nr:unnamed protein product [Digitaria exilis]
MDDGRRSEEEGEAWRRWSVLVATVWVQALTGTNFDFSAYSSALKSSLGISQEALNYLATASDLGKAFGWSSGLALLHMPLHGVLLVSAAMGFAAYALQYCCLAFLNTTSAGAPMAIPYPLAAIDGRFVASDLVGLSSFALSGYLQKPIRGRAEQLDGRKQHTHLRRSPETALGGAAGRHEQVLACSSSSGEAHMVDLPGRRKPPPVMSTARRPRDADQVFLVCLIAGCSICWFNTVCFVLCIRSFSTSNRPLALSLSISFNGLSAAFYTLFANALSPLSPSIYLLLNAILPLAVSILALPVILLCHTNDSHLHSVPNHDRRVFLGLYILAFITGIYLVAFGSFTTTSSTAWVILTGAMVLLALPLIIPACSHGPDPAQPLSHDDPHKPLLVSNNDQTESDAMMEKAMEHQLQGSCCGTILDKGRLVVLGEEHSAKKLIGCVDFWLYYTAYFCGATVGLVYSNNLGQIAQSLHQQSRLTMLLAVYSSFSFFGRLLSALPEFLHRKVSLARTGWLAAALLPMPMAFFLMWKQQDGSTLVVGTALVGLSSGFIFAAAVSVTSELFGPNSIGVNHNILITNIPLGSFLYGQIAALGWPERAEAAAAAAAMLRRQSSNLTTHALDSNRGHGGDLADDRRTYTSSPMSRDQPCLLALLPPPSPPRCSLHAVQPQREPAVTDVVQEEAPRSPETQGKDGEEEQETGAQRGALGWLRLDGVAVDILSIAVPAVLALAADPITTLVDTAFVGHIGSAQLAAVGASASVFNLVSKLFNVPLLNVTTSFVAEQQAVVDDSSNSIGQSFLWFTSIFLSDSPMRAPAEQFLTLRAYGAPPIIVALAAQGAFRGFLDTKTPLYAVGGLLIGRTIAVLLTMTLSTSLAAREGPVPMAAYEICLQVWLTISLLNDALALAGQALLASEYAKRNYKQARMVLYRVLQVGGVTGVALAATLFIGFGSLSLLFTDDPAVLDIAQSGVWFVTISQPVNAIAFVADGLYYG